MKDRIEILGSRALHTMVFVRMPVLSLRTSGRHDRDPEQLLEGLSIKDRRDHRSFHFGHTLYVAIAHVPCSLFEFTLADQLC